MVDETAPTERKPDNARQQQHAQQVLERFNEKKRREEKEVIVVGDVSPNRRKFRQGLINPWRIDEGPAC